MVDDMHYYGFAVIARAAGFTKKDALLMAYASQYVDDAIESKPIKVGGVLFDPVRTAHLGLRAYTWSVQKKVYIPFHFVPPNALSSHKDSFITQEDSQFARSILKEADKEKDHRLRLFRLAIAAHTYMDTFSHDGFSGRQHKENKVGAIFLRNKKNGKWGKSHFRSVILDLGPKVGHSSAGLLPDTPFQKFRYEQTFTGKTIERDNIDIYIRACKKTYKFLRSIKKHHKSKPIEWKNIKTDIKKLIKTPEKKLSKRCKIWKNKFGYLFKGLNFHYDRYTWRDEALGYRKVLLEEIPEKIAPILAEFPKKKGFFDSNWVMFHRAALLQRHYVMENLL